MAKKTKKRWGLEKGATRKPARDFVDFDYVDKLSEEEKDWLNRFSAEYYQNSLSKKDRKALHRTSDLRKAVYSGENARNRDAWNKWERLSPDIIELIVAEDQEAPDEES